jgi:hypothetical protein
LVKRSNQSSFTLTNVRGTLEHFLNIHRRRGDPVVLPGSNIAPIGITYDTGKNKIKLGQIGVILTRDKLGTASFMNCHGFSAGIGSDHYPHFRSDNPDWVEFFQKRTLLPLFLLFIMIFSP